MAESAGASGHWALAPEASQQIIWIIETRQMRTVAMLLCVAVLVGCAKPQPATVHGKTLEHWVQALQDRDGRVRRKAVEALGNVGAADAAVVPALAGALKDRDA